MDLKSFFIAMQENGRHGGLFVVAMLSFLFVVCFWQLAIGLVALAVFLKLLICGVRRLSAMENRGTGAILFFSSLALALAVLALAGERFLNIQAAHLVIPVAGVAAIFYSIFGLRPYLRLSRFHKVIYFIVPLLFAAAIGLQYLFDEF